MYLIILFNQSTRFTPLEPAVMYSWTLVCNFCSSGTRRVVHSGTRRRLNTHNSCQPTRCVCVANVTDTAVTYSTTALAVECYRPKPSPSNYTVLIVHGYGCPLESKWHTLTTSLKWWWCRASCPRMSVDILGTHCDQCRSTVHCCIMSTEIIRLVRTESPGRPPRLSHSSWTLHTSLKLQALV